MIHSSIMSLDPLLTDVLLWTTERTCYVCYTIKLQSSLAPLDDLLKTLMFLLNLNGFNSSPFPLIQEFNQRKGFSKVWKKKDSKWFYHFILSSCFCLLHYLCVLFLFWVSLGLCFDLFNMFLFIFSFCLFFFLI